ncbi:NAD-dependent deacetylase [Clostridium novyi B str. ATCC 27606]|uniref:NAD-dependent protein deacetylase n=2 Tax=Clostridium TaxID=1485 RepID=A0AA40ISC2_CLONO|nr:MULTISPECIES: NAD-dependent protein deacylase [Clostridium]KEI12742.1 NAD-dependent deacetylase [Clostridium novyi B str. ATCC 27606]KEI14775.1 NAD-dependent deacetylase [Clostridium novyi B str. NCTC 9691]OOB76455.1 NAD-dependent deacetylase [Clostridium haemolyticum]
MNIMDNIQKLKEIINTSSKIVFFGGAGVSTESNIPDFRSENGIYKTKDNFTESPEVMLSHGFFMKHTEDFFNFYKAKMVYKDAKPNDAHIALAKLEAKGKLNAIITQNIDGLHQLAGSKNVLELHGSVLRNYCMKCGKSFNLDYVMNSNKLVPYCDKCGGIVKPDVVLYEEELNMDVMYNAIKHIKEADTLIVGGTSLVVYPAAGLIQYFNGDNLVLINKAATPYDDKANLVINNSIGKILKEVVV